MVLISSFLINQNTPPVPFIHSVMSEFVPTELTTMLFLPIRHVLPLYSVPRFYLKAIISGEKKNRFHWESCSEKSFPDQRDYSLRKDPNYNENTNQLSDILRILGRRTLHTSRATRRIGFGDQSVVFFFLFPLACA